MRKLIVFILVGFVLSCQKKDNVDTQIEQKTVNEIDFTLTPKHFDIGVISKSNHDSIHDFSFDILNNTTDSVYLGKVDVSCGCVNVIYKSNVIPPGEHGIVSGNINISNQYGHLSKAIFVNYDVDGLIVLRIKGDVKD